MATNDATIPGDVRRDGIVILVLSLVSIHAPSMSRPRLFGLPTALEGVVSEFSPSAYAVLRATCKTARDSPFTASPWWRVRIQVREDETANDNDANQMSQFPYSIAWAVADAAETEVVGKPRWMDDGVGVFILGRVAPGTQAQTLSSVSMQAVIAAASQMQLDQWNAEREEYEEDLDPTWPNYYTDCRLCYPELIEQGSSVHVTSQTICIATVPRCLNYWELHANGFRFTSP